MNFETETVWTSRQGRRKKAVFDQDETQEAFMQMMDNKKSNQAGVVNEIMEFVGCTRAEAVNLKNFYYMEDVSVSFYPLFDLCLYFL